MTNVSIKFTGRDDSRILSANDLKKAGVEGFTKTVFPKGEAVEVSKEVAEALMSKEAIFGKFERVEREAPEKANTEATEKKASSK